MLIQIIKFLPAKLWQYRKQIAVGAQIVWELIKWLRPKHKAKPTVDNNDPADSK